MNTFPGRSKSDSPLPFSVLKPILFQQTHPASNRLVAFITNVLILVALIQITGCSNRSSQETSDPKNLPPIARLQLDFDLQVEGAFSEDANSAFTRQTAGLSREGKISVMQDRSTFRGAKASLEYGLRTAVTANLESLGMVIVTNDPDVQLIVSGRCDYAAHDYEYVTHDSSGMVRHTGTPFLRIDSGSVDATCEFNELRGATNDSNSKKFKISVRQDPKKNGVMLNFLLAERFRMHFAWEITKIVAEVYGTNSLYRALESTDCGQVAQALWLLSSMTNSFALHSAFNILYYSDAVRERLNCPIDLQSDCKPRLRDIAAWYLGTIGGDLANRRLLEACLATDGYCYYRNPGLAVVLLKRLHSPATAKYCEDVFRSLEQKQFPYDSDKHYAIFLIGETGTTNSVDFLSSLLNTPDERVQAETIIALGKVGSLTSLKKLEPFLVSEKLVLKSCAVWASRRISERSGIVSGQAGVSDICADLISACSSSELACIACSHINEESLYAAVEHLPKMKRSPGVVDNPKELFLAYWIARVPNFLAPE